MTTFNSAGQVSVDVRESQGGKILFTINTNRGQGYSAALDAIYAPAIALAILEAAGVVSVPFANMSNVQHAQSLLAEHVGIERNKAAGATREAARNKRRDELAKEFSELTDNKYEIIGMFGRKAIERIIDLEEAQK